MKITLTALLLFFTTIGFTQLLTRYEQSNFTETATYEEAMAFYRSLEESYEEVRIIEHGTTDIGLPLHVVLINTGNERSPDELQTSDKAIWLINNAIHPGEPDGVSASQLFARDLMQDMERFRPFLDKVTIVIIPFYNIGGALNRNTTTRVNQNGPVEYGFRGNARHYDLNRDFIKSDTRNAIAFQEIFQQYDPDFILDTHTSNGADYQHTMTLVYSQKDKLGGELGKFLDSKILPQTYAEMKERGFESIPYVNAWGRTPDQGWSQFVDLPRYSTGYAALFHTPGFMSETHMLKSFESRVQSTYELMMTILKVLHEQGEELVAIREATKQSVARQKSFEISWSLDTSEYKSISFSGYEPVYVESEISGLRRLKYDKDQPFTKEVKFMDSYRPEKGVKAPRYYLIPQQWNRVIELLELNQVELIPLEHDSSLLVESYQLSGFETSGNAYEGHFRHTNVEVTTNVLKIDFRKGDFLVPVNQWRNRYIVETLEPEAPDSFFSWNFFDAILQQKEHFSSYVFEQHALSILEENPQLREALKEAKASDPELAKSTYRQLDFIYQRSEHREPEYLRYPIFRVME